MLWTIIVILLIFVAVGVWLPRRWWPDSHRVGRSGDRLDIQLGFWPTFGLKSTPGRRDTQRMKVGFGEIRTRSSQGYEVLASVKPL
jgi:hypothetical protein